MRSMIAAASFWFNRAIRIQIQWVLRCHSKLVVRPGARQKWRTISEDLDRRGSLQIISVVAPRWNCHALLASISPIWIERSLTLELAGFGSQADSWSVVLYDDSLKMRQWIGSATISEMTVTWNVPPGAYTLSLRYYTEGEDIEVPAVIIDDSVRVVGAKIAGEASRYRRHLENIRNRGGPYFRLLHYYVFYYLSRQEKSATWLRQQFLPLGNPDTKWHYGHLAIGEKLRIRCDDAHRRTYNTYVCFYNWASFPVEWQTIRSLEWCCDPFEQAVGFAIRRVRRMDSGSSRNPEVHFEAFGERHDPSIAACTERCVTPI
jgi:hypothetical protein